jgi:uncharacterized protein YjiS (DUF1127 family)
MSIIHYSMPSAHVIDACVARAEAQRRQVVASFIKDAVRMVIDAFSLVAGAIAAARDVQTLSAMSDAELKHRGIRREDIAQRIAGSIGVAPQPADSTGIPANRNALAVNDRANGNQKAA